MRVNIKFAFVGVLTSFLPLIVERVESKFKTIYNVVAK